MMEVPKLKSYILERVCRTCLKMNEILFNIFQYPQNYKLISDLIMECTPIKVYKNDGLPVNICTKCIEELNSTCKFITMIVQSDLKLQDICKMKCEELSNNYVGKPLHVEHEGTKLIHSPGASNFENDVSVTSIGHSAVQSDYDRLSFSNELIKQKSITQCVSFTKNNDENMLFPTHINYNSNSADNVDLKGQIITEVIKRRLEGYEVNASGMSKKSGKELSNAIIKFETRSEKVLTNDQIVYSQRVIKGLVKKSKNCNSDDKQISGTLGFINKRRLQKQNKSERNVNEKQAELLDNPDYKRIMQMGLSKKEKAHQPVFCRECNKTFTFRYFVGIHAHLHTGNLPFKCDRCGTSFPKKPILKQHLRTHIETKEFSCEECGKAFTTIYCLRLHMNVHSNNRPYKCNICSKTFKYSFMLTKHDKTHRNDKNHICEECGKTFIDLANLRNHQLIHSTTGKNFECKFCGKMFSLKRGLRIHVKIHSNERPHVCCHCGKSFKHKSVLQNHLLIHTGEKPFTCEVCGKKFRHRSTFSLHARVHTGETPFPCQLCTACFKYKHHLSNHMKVHNKGDSPKVQHNK